MTHQEEMVLSETELLAVEKAAQKLGLTVEQALERLARDALQAAKRGYRLQVVEFKARKTA